MRAFSIQLRKVLLCNSFYYLLLIFSLIYVLFVTKIIKYETKYDHNTNNISGIIDFYKIDGDKITLVIIDKEKIIGNYYVKEEKELAYLKENLKYGSSISINGSINKPINNTIPSTFNYKEYLYNKKIYITFNIESLKINKTKISLKYKIKNMFLNKFSENDKVSNYINILVLGNKNNFDSNEMNNYQINGVTHLFAISGMHIGVLSLILLKIFKRMKINEDKAYFIVIIFLWFYAFITSFSGSVLRSTMFFTLLSLNKIYYTNVKTLNVMILSIIILMFINPFIIYDIGFLYSVVTSLGLIYYGKYLNKGTYFTKLIKTSGVAMLFSLPITINSCYEINVLSLFNNMIFVPFVTLVLYPICLITYFLPFISPVVNLCIIIIEWLNEILSSIKIFLINIPKMNLIFIIIFYICLLVGVNKKKILFINLLLILLVKIITKIDSNAYVYFLDIGQGDSAVLISPYKSEVIMIDTGGKLNYTKESWALKNKTYNVSDNVIIFLKSLGITKIDLMVLTHGDEDHAGEAINIMSKLKVKKLMINNGEYNHLEQEILKINTKLVNSYNGYFKINNLNTKDYKNENDNSIISLIKVFKTNILFMGDASKKQELELIKKYKLNVDILKLGHHGSKTSSDKRFLAAIKPKMSIISSGRNNRFNHPHQITIDNLSELNIDYKNTQVSGTIKYIINQNNCTFLTYPP